MTFWLFIVGSAVGSFLNVLSLRYRGEKFLFDPKTIGGRSECPHCRRTLRWFELIPVVSYLLQAGRCRTCRRKISLQYPLVEILSGLIFVFVPMKFLSSLPLLNPVSSTPAASWPFVVSVVSWLFVFLILLLMTVIDIRLTLIPDELAILLVLLGVVSLFFVSPQFDITRGSFLGSYALLFGFSRNIWWNHLTGAALGGLFLGVLFILSHGRAMGMGDVKLALALGFLFGWPDILLALVLAFILGALVGLLLILRGRKTLKSFLPFGPFLALGSVLTFFFGHEIVEAYFRLFSL